MTFKYTAQGPVGLLTGKKALIFAARGGKYSGTPMDAQTTFIRVILGFIGIIDVEFIYAEGLATGEESKQTALTLVHEKIARLREVALPA